MPEQTIIGTEVKTALDSLEHYCLENHLSRAQDYTIINNALEKDETLTLEETERLLAVCVHDLKDDMKYTATIMNIIAVILSRVKMGKYDPCPDLLPSALAVVQIIKTTALLIKVESLKVLCYDTLLSYPDDILIAVAEHHEEVLEIFKLYCHVRIPIEIRLQVFSVLFKLLKILPAERKKVFIEKGIAVWFSKIIPTIMSHINIASAESDMNMEILEVLTDELVTCDYAENSQWRSILECICSAEKYPSVMKNLLQKGSCLWYRLWIVFIRLLKHQVTQSLGTIGTPINSMLPVVEAAFKVDVENRCRAFECWNQLIDSFSTETNESNINKRIKLLIIPLRSNNAKTEATALAKFRCWWHLIYKFQEKIDKFLDIILISFLHFCFGRHSASDKSTLVPGQISMALKKKCILAIVDLVGHVNCDGCTDLPKLKGKMINTKHLVDNWNHWVFSLTSTIMMSATSNDDGLTKQQMSCLWKSFHMTIGELPENNIRKDLFAEMLSILVHLVQECKSNEKLADLVFNALVLSLFDKDIRIKQLLKTKNDLNDPLYKIVKILLDPSLNIAYQSCNIRELVAKLRPVTDMILDPDFSSPRIVTVCLLKTFPATDIALILWTALVESTCESKCDLSAPSLCSIMLWPLHSVNMFNDVKISAMTWYTAYDMLHPKLKETEIDMEVWKFLVTAKVVTNSIIYFKLCVALSLLKHKLTEKSCTELEKEINLLQNLISNIDSYESFEPLFPILIQGLLGIINIVISHVNETLARHILVSVKKVLTVMTQACNQQSDVTQILSLIESLWKPLAPLFKVESYSKLIPVIVDDLIQSSSHLSKQSLTKSTVLIVMKTLSSKIVETDITSNKIKAIIEEVESDTKNIGKNLKSDKTKFTTPKSKVTPKRTKKKETSIVNTVVENGEEYVVVKSNWKFNPRKLTENQKEKLQRKRDIPALYQDLSQSQDEFKLVSWKTDSQDTSNSSKSESNTFKSDSNETATDFLKNMPSSNVVPKILEIFFENEKKDSPNAKDLSSKDNINVIEDTTLKNTKSPRMALKDRVFRNVRNLIEKSGVQKENKDVSEDLHKSENIIKTPTQFKINDSANIVNSAPPLLSADRPSRVKRKPKKFDELLLITANKRQSILDMKSDDRLAEPNVAKNPSETEINSDFKNIGKVWVPPVTDNNEGEPEDKQLPENQNISGLHKINQRNKNVQKNKFGMIKNGKDKMDEEKRIENESKGKNNSNLDLDNTGKSNKMLDDNKDEKSDSRKEDESTIRKDEKAIGKQDTKTIDDKVQMSNAEKLEKPTIKTDEKSKDKKDKNTNNMKFNEKMRETSSENPNYPSKDVTDISTPQQLSKNKRTLEQKSITNKNGGKKPRVEKEFAFHIVDDHLENMGEKIKENDPSTDVKEVSTHQQQLNNKESQEQKSTTKNTDKKSGIEKELIIDMVDDHQEKVADIFSENDHSKEVSAISISQQLSKTKETQEQKSITNKNSVKKSRIEKELKMATNMDDNSFEKIEEKQSDNQNDPSTDVKEISTPQQMLKNKGSQEQMSTNKNSVKKSRIGKELVIDMVDDCQEKMGTNSSENEDIVRTTDVKEISTPQTILKNKGIQEQKSTTKKNSIKKSKIEKELAIDMVDGHPFLKMQSQKRLTRKALETAGTGRRKILAEKIIKSKSEGNSSFKSDKKTKEKNKESDTSTTSHTVDESQEKYSEAKDQTSFPEELDSEDIIESSQDSTITTVSVKSTNKVSKKVPVVALQKMKVPVDKNEEINDSQSILDCVIVSEAKLSSNANQCSKDDIEFPLNKTALEERSQTDLTENMDTEPFDDKDLSEVVIVINDDVPPPLTISSDESVVGPETQEIAEADTQPTDPRDFMHTDEIHEQTTTSLTGENITDDTCSVENKAEHSIKYQFQSNTPVDPTDNTTITLSDSACRGLENECGASSPSAYGNEAQRKQDFLNNTLEISPIKNMSPDRNKKTPSPETSGDYVVIKLSSPVHSNGEPFEKCASPEVFTEDKVSPDKRDLSPPRVEVTVTNTSPSSSLSLKKNRPQVRSGGRAAQMLGLCVPDKLQAIMNPEKNETEEVKKGSTSSTPVRRNLRILYNSVNENTESSGENDDSENFLRFRRSLPAVDSSPSGPILKRKLIEIVDDATISPASKRKRVSFHDPPVSTSISVQKYIEPAGARSPQNSAQKRIERQLRQQTPLKSPKRLDHAFKLDTVLTKAIESFSETEVISPPDDTQPFSLDETPVVEIVRASELNDTDPICPNLLDCMDPIDIIASELSSPAMKSLLVQELVGKVETVGDLAKMTELEVNRLCIKAPKVKVAKKVLTDYALKRVEKPQCDLTMTMEDVVFDEPMTEPESKRVDMEIQTDRNASCEMEVQTIAMPTIVTFVQTETIPTAHTSVQTDESGSKSTSDIIKLCLAERPDFVEQVGEHLEESSIQQITDKLPFSALTDVLMNKVTLSHSKSLLNTILEQQCNNTPDENHRSKGLSFIRDYICDRFESKDLILFCSEVLMSVYDKPT